MNKLWILLKNKYALKNRHGHYRSIFELLHIDFWLLATLLITTTYGLVILYSASNADLALVKQQLIHLSVGFLVMLLCAQVSPQTYRQLAPWFYFIVTILLIVVLLVGHIKKGGQRWINLGIFHFQPSELLKIAIPLFLASIYHQRTLPISLRSLSLGAIVILVPTVLAIKQPDLSTAMLLIITGTVVLFLAGLSLRIMLLMTGAAVCLLPLFWHFMHDYQKARVLTFLNPERDPLGTGYHIIQSKIAIGSGGLLGKGFLLGSQVHLKFLPENTTDFIFSVCAEEFGLLGCLLLILCYILITLRGCYIALESRDIFTRLLAASLVISFFFCFFINVGMVTGILPVAGIPLPLVSYGGTSLLTTLAGFGIIMSIHTHKFGVAR